MALQSGRAYVGGMGAFPLPISWEAVAHHADRLGCGADQRALLHEVIRALDADWMDREAARQKRRGKG